MEELEKPLSKGTEEFVFNQTMMRIKDPKRFFRILRQCVGYDFNKAIRLS